MSIDPGFEFSNLEKLIGAIGSGKPARRPKIDTARLLAEFAVVKAIVADSPFPDIKVRIPATIRPSITGPEIPIPHWTGPKTTKPRGHDVGITGPESDTSVCPVCRRPY